MTPKAFISYSWSNPPHEQWVIRLAEELTESGVDVTLDKWALKEGDDAHAFMEQMVTNPDITKVVMVCDKVYAEKANDRSGGVGTETQIITPELYGKQSQSKFVAVISERDEAGKEYVPVFYKSRIYIDMSDSAAYAEGFEKLLRWIYEKPVYVKPPIGKPPAFLETDDRPKILTTVRFRRAQELLRNGQPHASAAVKEYFDALAEGLEQFRLGREVSAKPDYDDAVVKSIADFLSYRDECVSLFQLIASYVSEEDIPDLISPFFEQVLVYTERPPDVMQYREWDFDNFRFIAHELFLYTLAALLKAGKFRAASLLIDTPFYISSRADADRRALLDYSAFLKQLNSLKHRNQRLKLNRWSLQADLLKDRATITNINFRDLVQADFVLYLHGRLAGVHWFPITNVFESFVRTPFEIFARARSAAYFERIRPLLGNRTLETLKADVVKLESNPAYLPHWDFYTLTPSACIDMQNLATRP